MVSLRSALVASSCLVVACSSFSAADAPATPDVPFDQADGGANPDAGDPVVGTPLGCDPMAEPQKSPNCIVDAYGIFVDATNGDDAKPGTKAAPLKTLASALSKLKGRSRVYVCEGVLAERVRLSPAASLFGGFACGTWAYSGGRARFVPLETGPALTIDGVGQPIVISDLEFVAPRGTDASPSSIAAFITTSADITFRRVTLTAQNAAKGADGVSGASGTLVSSSPTPGTFNATKLGQKCTCSIGAMTAGGDGGLYLANAVTRIGKDGLPAQAVVTPDGADGLGVDSFLDAHRGSDAPPAANGPGADHLFDLMIGTATPFVPASGTDGSNGFVGQGGGGSGQFPGGVAQPAKSSGFGGGCGGCGGHKGTAGRGGGSSITVLSIDSPLHFVSCALNAGDGGKGGDGGAGGGGSPGGKGALTDTAAKSGGDGGNGSLGGAGGGGPGGLSVGIAYRGAKPAFQGTTSTGTLGQKGAGGIPGTNDGIDGVKVDLFQLP